MKTRTKQPGANARSGRAVRSVVYPAFTQTGPDTPAEGARPIYLYLRLSKYHKDKADAIERQRLDLTRKLAAEGGWTVMGEYIDNDSASVSAAKNRKGWRQLNQDIEAGTVPAVTFWKLDRTNRIAAKGPGPPVHADLCAVVDEAGRTSHEFTAEGGEPAVVDRHFGASHR